MKDLGYGKDYRFPHDNPEGWVPENYLPDALVGNVFYEPTLRGWEGKCKPFLEQHRERVKGASKTRASEGER
jgi:putative ATPase